MPSNRTEGVTLEGHVLALLAHVRALRATFLETQAALRALVGSCEQVAWTKRSISDVAKDGYWSFVPTDRVKQAAAVLARASAVRNCIHQYVNAGPCVFCGLVPKRRSLDGERTRASEEKA